MTLGHEQGVGDLKLLGANKKHGPQNIYSFGQNQRLQGLNINANQIQLNITSRSSCVPPVRFKLSQSSKQQLLSYIV